MNHRFTRWILLLVSLFLLPGCKQEAAEEGERTVKYDPVPVKVAAVQKIVLHPTAELIGIVAAIPERTAVVASQAAGMVAKLEVAEGASVRAGQVLATLDDRAAQNDLARAVASVQEKTAVLARLKRGYLPQEIDAARQDARKFAAVLETINAKFLALTKLKSTHEVSDVQYESIRSALRAGEAELAAANAKLALLEAGTRSEEIAEAQAKLAAAGVDQSAAELALKLGQLPSPIDGVAVAVPIRLGQSLERGASVATIIDLSKLFVQFRIPTAYLEQVHAGSSVQVTPACTPGKILKGSIARLSGQADPATGSLDAFAIIDNEGGTLRPGICCRITVALPEIADALTIPPAALADRSGDAVVTLIKDGKAREVQVELGVHTADHVQILSGLSAGDLVAIENGYGLPDDCPVKIIEPGEKAKETAPPK